MPKQTLPPPLCTLLVFSFVRREPIPKPNKTETEKKTQTKQNTSLLVNVGIDCVLVAFSALCYFLLAAILSSLRCLGMIDYGCMGWFSNAQDKTSQGVYILVWFGFLVVLRRAKMVWELSWVSIGSLCLE